jgi:asparagine synthase (glutamine-hydrolysing)
LGGELRDYARDALLGGALADDGLIETAPVQRLLDAHVAGKAENSRPLWALLMLSLWLERD